MGTAPASTLGCEEPFVSCNKALTQWHRGVREGHSGAEPKLPTPLCPQAESSQSHSSFRGCSSLIYLANLPSAGGFTLENVISGISIPGSRGAAAQGELHPNHPAPAAYPAGPCLSFDSTNSWPIFSFSHSSFRVLIFRGFTFPRFGFSFFSF